MKKILPLLFLVACADVDSLERNLRSCRSDLDRTQTSLLWCKEDKTYMDNLLDACQANLNMRAEVNPKIVTMPSRPHIRLDECRVVDNTTFCKESDNKGPWYNFDCRQLEKDAWFCKYTSCLAVTSDGKSCAL